ncbi:MAG: AI-2E family transporter [Acidimicrobiales bacterium]
MTTETTFDDGDKDRSMPPWLPRAIAMGAFAFAVVFSLAWLVQRLRGLLVLLLMSLFFSFALEPAVNWLHRKGIRRGFATLLVFLGVAVGAVAFLWAMGAVLADQIAILVDEAPGYITEAQAWLAERGVEVNVDDLLQEFQDGGAAASFAQDLAGNLLDVGTTILSVLFQALTVGLFTFYLTADGPRLRRSICSILPPRRQREVLQIWDLAVSKTGGYIYSRVVLATLSFAFHWVVFVLIGVPSPLALAMWVAVVSQFVPVVGTYLAGIFPVLLALLEEPISALWVVIAIVLYQQIENYLFAPPITASTMEMHPAVAFGSVVAGTNILGGVGALLAIPAAAVIQAFVASYVQRHELIESGLLTDDGMARSRLTPDRTGEIPIIDITKGPPPERPQQGDT